MSRTRIAYIDIAKGFAMFCIIAGHFGILTVNRFVYTFHVPLFFLLSGYFLSTKLSIREFAKKRFFQLVVPYFVVGFSYTVVVPIAQIIIGASVDQALQGALVIPASVLYGAGAPFALPEGVRAIGVLWFLPALFVGSLVARAALSTDHPWIVVIAASLIGLVSTRVLWLPMSIQPGLISSFFVLVGREARKRGIFERKPNLLVCFALAALWAVCIFFDIEINIVGAVFVLGPVCVVNSIGASYLVVLACKSLSEHFATLSNFLFWCGQATFAMMCFHALADFAFPNYLLYSTIETSLHLPHWFANIVVLLLNMAWAVAGIPISRRIPPLRRLFSLGDAQKIQS